MSEKPAVMSIYLPEAIHHYPAASTEYYLEEAERRGWEVAPLDGNKLYIRSHKQGSKYRYYVTGVVQRKVRDVRNG